MKKIIEKKSYNRYKIEDIEIGGEVYFYDV